jgi:hypothetical protein
LLFFELDLWHDLCRHGWGPSASLIYDTINRPGRRPNRN